MVDLRGMYTNLRTPRARTHSARYRNRKTVQYNPPPPGCKETLTVSPHGVTAFEAKITFTSDLVITHNTKYKMMICVHLSQLLLCALQMEGIMAPGIVTDPSVEVCGYGGLPKTAWNDIHAPSDHIGLQKP